MNGLQMIVKFPTGMRKPGLVLSMSRERMRVLFPGFPDVVELRSLAGFWVSEEGEPFAVEGLLGSCPPQAPVAFGVIARQRSVLSRQRTGS
jgi:hypothetical protein